MDEEVQVQILAKAPAWWCNGQHVKHGDSLELREFHKLSSRCAEHGYSNGNGRVRGSNPLGSL
jgi:hypothetical protein